MTTIEENRKILQEELSISDHVLTVTDKIYDMVKQGNTTYELVNFDFIGKLTFTCHLVFYQNGGATGRCNSDTATLDNNGKLICEMSIEGNFSKKLDPNLDNEMNYFKSAIQHEVHHLYQAYCKLHNKKQHNISSYYKAGVLAQQTNNDLLKRLGIIYYATDSEQDAFVNTLYQLLINLNSEEYNVLFDKVKETQAWVLLVGLKKAHEALVDRRTYLLPEYKHMIKWLSTNYNIEFNLKETLKLCLFRIKRLESKIGKVITKVKKDKDMIFSEVNFMLDESLTKRFYEIVNY